MNRILFICNSGYQIIVATWIRYRYFKNQYADLLLTDHMTGGEVLYANSKKSNAFNEVYYAHTLDIARYRKKNSRLEAFKNNIFPMKELNQIVRFKNKYSDIFAANFDGFTQMIFNAMSHRESSLKLHIFEDSLSSYMEFEKYYNYFKSFYSDGNTEFKKLLHRLLYNKKPIYGNVEDLYLFNPKLLQWNPGCPVRQIESIDKSDETFRNILNQIFGYDECNDVYDTKYLFLEESFFADGENISDIALVEELSKLVGKENIMIKIHPRNPINRFAELGYKTNQNTSIPWEVILLNMENADEKVLLTVASSAILNPLMVFDLNIKAYSLYDCLDTIPNRLKGETWKFLKQVYSCYPKNIRFCKNICEIL